MDGAATWRKNHQGDRGNAGDRAGRDDALIASNVAMSAFLLISSALPPKADIPDRPVNVRY